MAYHGVRDPEVAVIMPYTACKRYNAKVGKQLIECMVPPESAADYGTTKWGTIMVEPSQVRAVDTEQNIVFLNNGANITNSVKDDTPQRNIISTETLLPSEIIGRWLKWFRYTRFANMPNLKPEVLQNLDCSSIFLYEDYKHSNMSIENYANRVPFIL